MAELDLNDVAMFVRVIEHAGFAKASRVLGVPTSTVSRAVSRLEEAAGALLVHRNTRNVSTTSEGQSYALFFALAANDREAFDKILLWTENNLADGSLKALLDRA